MRTRRGVLFSGVAVLVAAGAGLAAVPAGATPPPATTPAGDRLVNAVVVAKPGVPLPLHVGGGKVLDVFSRLGSELVRAPESALQALATNPRVAGVSADRAGHVTGYGGADAASSAGVFASDGLGGNAGDADAGEGVNVALLDTGVSSTPALNRSSGRITDGVDVSHLSDGGQARTSGVFTDGYGHGTFLASLIAGGPVAGSGGKPLGVAPAARIVVVKVADNSGETTLAQVLAGMDWVAAHAQGPDGQQMIQVLNLALAMDRPTAPAYGADPLTTAVEHVRAAGVLVVAAAGNQPGQVGDPGMDPQALTIGAADLTGRSTRVASFSGSAVVAGVPKPDVVASGVRLLGLVPANSTIAREHPDGWQPNGLFRGSGTSEATAVASGVAAVWLSEHPGASALDAKAALRSATTNVAGNGIRSGTGLLTLADGNRGRGNASGAGLGERSFDPQRWQDNAWSDPAWNGTGWQQWLASSWSASSWSASSWSASSWSASSWSASSWSASSWSASSWSDFGWGDDA
ncbi:MAG TPA: S8 family serine peptidase [Mycobacteriales bacterium]|nr:S8 family serine peptidase [Mycobacteriales bacterium]